MQLGQEQLHKKNQELVEMYREKSKKHTQVTNLYNLLKSRAMRSQIQSAASDSVAHTLESFSGPRPQSTSFPDLNQSLSSHTPAPRVNQQDQYPIDHSGIDQLHRHQKSGSGSGNGNTRTDMGHDKLDVTSMPPPNRTMTTRSCQYLKFRLYVPSLTVVAEIPIPTPQQHRTCLPTSSRPASRIDHQRQQQTHQYSQRTPPGFVSGSRYAESSQNRPLGNSNSPRFNQGVTGGFGLSAGMKIGRSPSNIPPKNYESRRSGLNGQF